MVTVLSQMPFSGFYVTSNYVINRTEFLFASYREQTGRYKA